MIVRVPETEFKTKFKTKFETEQLKMTILFKLTISLSILVFSLFSSATDGSLLQAVSNNAVTSAKVNNQTLIFSFSGLTDGKTYRNIISSGFSFNLDNGKSETIAGIPDKIGRLASIAVTINNRVLVIGGYSVAKDHSEKSTAEIYEYLPVVNRYEVLTKMPVPVDDTVALVYKNRYLYLVSGWFDTGNVSLVQVYDIKNDIWFNATPFPGAPVFGHAGGIVDNQFVIADGVKVVEKNNGKRAYAPSDENWLGEIQSKNPAEIKWEKIKRHPFKPHYRMASTGISNSEIILFTGGSDNPYNFNGIGYDGKPSKPSSKMFAYDLKKKVWKTLQNKPILSMDHRGLIEHRGNVYIVGGMGKNQRLLSNVQKINIDKRLEKNGSN